MKHIVSLSGGKDSTAMLLMMIENRMTIDSVNFADVGEMAEFEEMYGYLDKVEAYTGIPINRLRSTKHTAKSIFYGYPTKGNHMDEIRGFPPTVGPGCRYRSWLKTDVLDAANGTGNTVYIGIAADEAHRAERNEYMNGKNTYRFPLVEWGITENQCLQYLRDRGLANELYDYFRRLGCFWCPKQPLRSLENLYRYFPNKWETLRQLEADQRRPFKHGYSVKELEKKFDTKEVLKHELKNEDKITVYG